MPTTDAEIASSMPRLVEMWPAHDTYLERTGTRYVFVFQPVERVPEAVASCRTRLLEDALQLVHLCADHGSPKYERAAMRWLERYLAEGGPRLRHFAEVAADLARRDP